MNRFLSALMGLLLCATAASAQVVYGPAKITSGEIDGSVRVTPNGGSPTTLGAALAATGGCTTNCTFGGTTMTGALNASGAVNTTSPSGYQFGGANFLTTTPGGGALSLGKGAGANQPSNNNFDVYIGFNAGNAQSALNGENTMVGWSNCQFCVSADGGTGIGVAALLLETASGAPNAFGQAGGLAETCVGADCGRNQVESSFISALGRRALAYGNINSVQALGFNAMSGNSSAITVTGTPTAGANITFTVTGNFVGSPQNVSVTIPAAPTIYTVANAVANAFQAAGVTGGSLQNAKIGADFPNTGAPAPAVARISLQGTSTVGPQRDQITIASQTDTATYTITGGLSAGSVIALGDFSLLGANATSLTNMIGIGEHVAQNVTNATNDVIICHFCAQSLQTGQNDFVIGSLTTDVFSGSTSTAVLIGNGAKAGTNDIVLGSLAGASTAADGLDRAVVGVNAFSDNTTGADGTGMGFGAGQHVSTGARNSFFGFASGQGLSGNKLTGNNNTGAGASSLNVIQGAANNNSAFGQGSLALCTTCATVTAMGAGSGAAVTTASTLAIFGSSAGNKATTLTSSLILGPSVASGTLATGTDDILIGTGGTVDLPDGTSHTLVISGNGSTPTLKCTGIATTPNCTFGGPLASTGAFNAPSVNNTGGNLLLGSGAALTNAATAGFILAPSMTGAPTGTVGASGQVAMVIDTTNKKLCYSAGGGTWECSAAFTP